MGLFDFLKPKKKGVDEQLFNSKQFQIEITALAQKIYFENSQDYSLVKEKLSGEGLDENQRDSVIENLRRLNADMVKDFQNELDSGRIVDIKITPNPEHQKGKVSKDQVDKYIAYGAYQMELNYLENALELFDKAIELDDKAGLAYANKGALYSRLKDNDKALYFYDKALETEPDNIQVLESKMDILFEILSPSNEDDFIKSVQACLKVDPMSPNPLIYIIQYYLKARDIENALISVKNLFSGYHSEQIAIRLLLDTFDLIGDKEKALEQFKKFENEMPGEAKYQLMYCKGLYLKGRRDFDEAVDVFQNLNKLQAFSWNYYQIAIIKNAQNEIDESLAYLKLTFDLEPALKEDAKQYPELQNLWADPKFIELTK